ncbi:hypothetical protein AAMO2058_001626600 [Amorphochlora amoebiformis]
MKCNKIESKSTLQVAISGDKRKEKVSIFTSEGKELHCNPKVALVLSMDKTFPNSQMDTLSSLVYDYTPPKDVQLVRLGTLRAYDSCKSEEAKKEFIESFSKAIINGATKAKSKGCRLVILSKVLFNDKHWQVVAVRVGETYWADRRARPEVFVVNSTNEAKMRSAKNLQEQYEKNGVLPSMRAACRAFSEVTGREWKGEVKFSYAQGLQYGNMGCGFACALNEVRLLRGDFENRIVQPGDRVTKKVKKEIKVDGEVISFVDEEIDKEKSVDRSIRVSMQEEARLRARLVLFTAATEGSISEKYKSIRTFDFRKLGTSPGESKT